MKKIDWKKFDPPGMDGSKEQGFYMIGVIASLVYSLGYFGLYWDAYRRLFQKEGDTKVIRPERAMEPFWALVDKHLMGYLIVGLCLFVTVWMRYSYYRQGSRSDYLMRRLPDAQLYHRTCWVRPLVRMGLCALAALVTLLVYFLVYVVMTPDVCLPWN